jgi:moderate conductance mechanosensitive channel
MWKRLFLDYPVNWQLVAAAVLPTALFAWLAAHAARRASRSALRHLLRDTVTTASPLVRAPLRLIGFATFGIVFAVLIFPAFEAAGLHPRAGLHLRTLSSWTFDSGLRVLLVAAVAFAIVRTVAVLVKRFEHDVNFGSGLDALERAKRARTLGSVLTNITTAVVLLIAVLMILREFHVDISPALTGAGIIGVALGFGAQTLVRDFIAGFFLLLENQVRVGDVVAINGVGGLVQEISLRTIVLRDEEGTVHVFPNGGITTLANRSMQFSYYVINLPLAYGEDTDEAAALVTSIAATLQEEDAYRPFILAPLEIIGVDAFEEHAVRLKVRIKTAPLKQWFVGRELRRRVLRAFAERGLEMWTPQRTVTLNTPQEPGPSSSSPRTPGQS